MQETKESLIITSKFPHLSRNYKQFHRECFSERSESITSATKSRHNIKLITNKLDMFKTLLMMTIRLSFKVVDNLRKKLLPSWYWCKIAFDSIVSNVPEWFSKLSKSQLKGHLIPVSLLQMYHIGSQRVKLVSKCSDSEALRLLHRTLERLLFIGTTK